MDVSNMLYISFQKDLWSIWLWGQKKLQFCGIGTNLSRSSGPSCQFLSYLMQYQKSRKICWCTEIAKQQRSRFVTSLVCFVTQLGRFWVNTPQLFIVITYHHLPSLTITYHHLPSLTITYHHLPSLTIACLCQTGLFNALCVYQFIRK